MVVKCRAEAKHGCGVSGAKGGDSVASSTRLDEVILYTAIPKQQGIHIQHCLFTDENVFSTTCIVTKTFITSFGKAQEEAAV